VESDPSVKASLEKKLIEIKERHQLNLVSLDDLMKETEQEEEDSDGNRPIRSQISNLVINAAVLSAIALKKSPIPGNDILLCIYSYHTNIELLLFQYRCLLYCNELRC
jgi:hypothetical protein